MSASDIDRIMFISQIQGKTDVVRHVQSITDAARLYGGEGVTWIRGHHDPDSEKVQALLVAYAISVNG